jgi:hypothetical protein
LLEICKPYLTITNASVIIRLEVYVFAIRREDAKAWPCPWITRNNSASSKVHAWPLAKARKYVDEHRSDDNLVAVYHISGFYHKKVYPVEKEVDHGT